MWLRVVVVAAAESEWDVGGRKVRACRSVFTPAPRATSRPQQYARYAELGRNLGESTKVQDRNPRNNNCSTAL